MSTSLCFSYFCPSCCTCNDCHSPLVIFWCYFFSAVLLIGLSDEHLSTTLHHNTSTHYFTTTLLHNTPSQHFTTTLLHNTPSQHVSVTLLQNTSLTSPQTLLHNTSPQHSFPALVYTSPQHLSFTTLLHNTPSESTTPVLQSTTPYYKLLLVLLRTTKHYSSTTPYYKALLQYYSVLESTTKLPKRAFRARLPQLFKQQASKTSVSCEASATLQATSFQNERFVRGFRNFSSNKLPKRAFRARLPQLFKRQASKTSVSCEASATFQATSFQNERFVRGFRKFSSNKLPKRAFRARLPQLFKEEASKVLRLPRKTRKWPLTLKVCSAKTSISCETSFKFHTFKWKSDDFVRVFLIKSFLQSSKSMTFAKLPPLFKTLTKYCACHDIWSNVTFARPCHCDLWKQLLRHVPKCCACHDIAKGRITKCCACHEKTTRLHWHASKVLRLSRKTRKWPHILWLGGAKTSISCETSSTFHTLKVRIVSQCECTAQWQRINDATTTRRRRDNDEATTRRRRGDDETAKQREHRSNPRPQL